MIHLILIFTTIILMLPVSVNGSVPESERRVITLEECISRALEANYSVVISENTLEITKNNITLSPFLPSFSLASRLNDSRSEQRNYNSDGSTDELSVKSTSVVNSANLSWRLFDGMSMFATREKQFELLAMGEYNFKSVVENLVMRISAQYFQIISLQNQVDLLTELVAISQIRYTQALTRYNIGSDSGLEYKQAKIYLNSDSSRLMLQKENLRNGYLELYGLMNLPFTSELQIKDTIIPESQLQLDALIEKVFIQNTTLNSLRAGEKAALLDIRIAKSAKYPTLDLSAGYNYNFNRSQIMPSRFNDSDGFNWGLSLSIPVFNGNEINRKIRNSGIAHENARLSLLKAEQDLEGELRQLYNLYNNNLRLIAFEEESRESASLNLEAAMEMYRLGSLSGIEFRDYQLSYMDASDRKLKALYQTKISEITLYLMAGELFR